MTDLVFKMELITLAARHGVQAIAHIPDKPEGTADGLIFSMGKKAHVFKVPGLFDIERDPGQPQHGMIIAQTALPFLKVRFEQVG